jgi:hypothetical protein
LLGARLPAAPQGQLAADGVTIVTTPANGTPSVVTGSLDGPGCPDVVYFEENGGAAGGRGLYDFISAAGSSSLRTTVAGSERLFGLATDAGGTVFGVDPLADSIYLVDLTSGTLTFLVGLVGVATVADITFDPISGQLYGAERNPPLNLYTIDLGSGVATTVGTLASVRSGLTFAPDGTLYGCALNGTLYVVDPLTAAETLVGSGGAGSLTLVEDGTVRPDGMIFVTDFDGDLFAIDPVTGIKTFAGTSGLGNGLLGIVPEPLAAAADEVVRLGSPPNPLALMPGLSSGPLIGSIWDPAIDHSSFFPGAIIDVLAVSSVALNAPSPFGTVLCNPSVLLAGVAGAAFPIPVPANCSLAGIPICLQGASTDGVSIVVTNAIDAVVGSF